MSFAGFKKQINKANQFMSEKIGGAKGSTLEEDFVELERKTDATAHIVEHVSTKTKEYLQPNPGARAKLAMQSTVHKVRGEAKVSKYPQPEGLLGETMQKGAQDLGEDSLFGQALRDAGEAFLDLAEIKDALDSNVKQNFLDPLDQLRNRDIKEIMHHRKKLQGRRLDYDCKKRKQHKIPEEDIKAAEEKFEESKETCYNSMMNLIESSDVEQVSELAALAEAVLDYHKHCQEVMERLVATLNDKVSEASSRPRAERRAPVRNHIDDDSDDDSSPTQSFSPPPVAFPSAPSSASNGPYYSGPFKALYDFESENDQELDFSEGDIIQVEEQIDENWLSGTINGKTGMFPTNYVEKM